VKTEDEIPADYKLFMRVQSFKCWLIHIHNLYHKFTQQDFK
jgi:hypothetical protein